jgi:hypothetical protein
MATTSLRQQTIHIKDILWDFLNQKKNLLPKHSGQDEYP